MVLEQDPVYPGAQVENHNILRHIFGGALAPTTFKDVVSGQLKKKLPLICSYLAGLVDCPTQFHLSLHAREPVLQAG